MNFLSGTNGAIVANLMWGASPLYYIWLGQVNALVLLCFQVIMTFLVLTALKGFSGFMLNLPSVRDTLPTAMLIGFNWAGYVVAVMRGEALQASYAYLIAPVLTQILASAAFRKPMPTKHKTGAAISAFSVLLDIAFSDRIPYLGFVIALPFAAYVVLHKKIGASNAVDSLQNETMILTPLAFVVLLVMMYQGGTPVLSVQRWVLLGLIGLVNALPLTLFIRATPRLSASQLGACQFIAPLYRCMRELLRIRRTCYRAKIAYAHSSFCRDGAFGITR